MIRYETESQLHKSVVDWLALHQLDCFWTTLEHGANGVARATKNKRMGVAGGLPDMMFIRKGHVFFIELKTKKGSVKQQQRDCHDAIYERGGGHTRICRSVDDVIGTLRAWDMLKARVT